ncbi:MAG: hypothetical protein IJR00_03545 [Lachnospiraceae bacterium]|nr:hypothetical protein [Lachnospiraceae bacterium]
MTDPVLRETSRIRCILLTGISLWAAVIVSGSSYRSIFLLPAAIALYLLFRKAPAAERGATAYVLAAVLTLSALLARYRQMTGGYESAVFQIITLLIAACGLFVLLLYLFRHLSALSVRVSESGLLSASRDKEARFPALRWFDAHPLLVSFAVCVIVRLPWFLYSFPGIANPDSVSQLEQAADVEALVNAHPVYHTLLLRLFLTIGGGVQSGTALYVIAQMLYMSFCCAYAVSFLRKLRLRRTVCLTALAFYALTPFMNVYSVIIWKDGPFAATLVLLSVSLFEMACAYREGTPLSARLLLRFAALCTVTMLLRSNAALAVLPLLVLAAIAFRKQIPRVLPALAAVAAVLLIALTLIPRAYGIGQSDLVEKLNLPVQQIARVITEGNTLPEEDEALVREVLGERDVSLWYDPYYADTMKAMVRTGDQTYLEEHRGAFLSLYLRWGLRYPGSYLRAYGDLTGAMLYPDLTYGIAEAEGIYENRIGLQWQPLLRGAFFVKLRELVTRLPYRIPLLSLLWSCGTYAWMLLITAALLWTQRSKRRYLALLAPAAALFLVLLVSTPIASEFRYVFGIVMCAPLWLAAPFLEEKGEA